MSETIKAADAQIGKWYWFEDQAWLCVINDGWGGAVRFYRPPGPQYELDTDDDVIPLPDDAGYDYELPAPEPEYRPFANAAEFEPHRDRWLRRHTKRGAFRVIDYSNECVYMQPSETDGCTYKWMFDAGYKFDDDGTPFGVEVTQ